MNKNKVKKEEIATRRKVVAPTKKNKGKHKKKTVKTVIYIAIVVFVLSLLFLIGFGIYKLCTSTKYNISVIKFEGNAKYTDEEIIKVLNVNYGDNLFKLSKSIVKENLEELSYIENVKISKKYPNTLIVKIKEYESCYFAYNKDTNKYIKLTKNGIILESCELEAKNENELLVFGINFDETLGKDIVDIEKSKLTSYMSIKEKYDEIGIDKQITSVEFKEGNVILTLNYDINVIMATNEIAYKLSFLKSILGEIVGKAGTIDMTIENPIFSESIK